MQIPEQSFMPATDKRIFVITGHYGSGKTEYAVSLAMLAAERGFFGYPRAALADLDYINPYFRSRERMAMLEKAGVRVYGSSFRSTGITAELPDFDASVRAPLDDEGAFLLLDIGGNDAGARILHQFADYFTRGRHVHLCVVNGNRYETRDPASAAEQISAIETETGLPVDGVINNTHLLAETSPQDVIRGHGLCLEVCRMLQKPLWCDCYPRRLVRREDLPPDWEHVMPLGMYMRETWLDK